MRPRSLDSRTTDEVRALLTRSPNAVLLPIGSVEPHGPHLPLSTDTAIAEEAASRACDVLASRGVEAWLAPAFPYGVTELGAGFAGCIGLSAAVLVEALRGVVARLLADGWAHVCLVNDHLEPEHEAALRAAVAGHPPGAVSIATPTARRWARTLSEEFRRGACHAGRYETSLALAAGTPVRDVYRDLPAIETSLSRELARGCTSFAAMGLSRAYSGAPSEASAEEGEALFGKHVAMIVAEVVEGLERRGHPIGDGSATDEPTPQEPVATDPALEGGAVDPATTFATRERMDPQMIATLMQMMLSHAYRELAAARLFGSGLQHAPDLKSLRFLSWHIREETEHYAAVARMYRDFTGESLETAVHARLAKRPLPSAESWLELAMAQFLFDRGGFWQLREYEQCVFTPYRDVVRRIVREEAGHQGMGERIVVELCARARGGDGARARQRVFEKWLKLGLLSFGRARSEASAYAVAVGLKRRDPGEVMRDFLDDILPAMRACDLRFPPPGALGLELPHDVEEAMVRASG